MRKIDGVSDVKISLKEGAVTLRFAPSHRVTMERIRETIRSNGFAPKESDVRITGRLAVRGDSVLLLVPETNESYVLDDAPKAVGRRAEIRRSSVGTMMVVNGQVPASGKQPATRPRRLMVQSFSIPPAADDGR